MFCLSIFIISCLSIDGILTLGKNLTPTALPNAEYRW
jgi:hypothetical protein